MINTTGSATAVAIEHCNYVNHVSQLFSVAALRVNAGSVSVMVKLLASNTTNWHSLRLALETIAFRHGGEISVNRP